MPIHTIKPFFSSDSEILILGSFPSVKSRETGFYYGHPHNRFWNVIANVYGEPIPRSVEEKKEMLAAHKIALWDVIASCEINGSSDASIKNITVNPVEELICSTNVDRIITNGKTAQKYYEKYLQKKTALVACDLPSTSPANAAYSLEALIKAWSILLNK